MARQMIKTTIETIETTGFAFKQTQSHKSCLYCLYCRLNIDLFAYFVNILRISYLFLNLFLYFCKRMDSLFLLQFACFIFMLVNAFFVALSHLHVRWENKRYERSRWMIVVALLGLAIQYVIQMGFGFRAADDSLGAVVNILVYTPCFSLISMGIYNIETTRSNLRKMILMCSGISFFGSRFSLCRLPSFPPPYYI